MLQVLLFGFWGSITGGQKFRIVAEGPNKGLGELKELIEDGKLVPIVDKRYKLSEVPEALRYFTEGRHAGKVVVDIAS
jgi:NADPH:quinone reductase-like Zn-dependent oxidoreductase